MTDVLSYMTFPIALFSMIVVCGLMDKVSKLDRQVKLLQGEKADVLMIINTLKESIGKEVKLDFYNDISTNLHTYKVFKVLDVDNKYVEVDAITLKKKVVKNTRIIIPLEIISSVSK